MKKDKLEQFIDDNREDLDQELPPLNLWGEIDSAIHPKPIKKKRIIAGRAAASIALLVVAGWFFLDNGTTKAPLHLNTAPVELISENNPEFQEITEFYSNKINNNMGRLTSLNHHDPELYRDLRQMEAYYDTLRMEWSKNPHKSDEQLINAMIENYRSRSMLLENVVDRLEDKQHYYSRAQPALFHHK